MSLPLSQALSIVTGVLGAIKSTHKSTAKVKSINELAQEVSAPYQADYETAQELLKSASTQSEVQFLTAERSTAKARLDIIKSAEIEAVQTVRATQAKQLKGLAIAGVSVTAGISQWAINRNAMIEGQSANRNLGAVSAQNISAQAQQKSYVIQNVANTANTAMAFAINPVFGFMSLAGQVIGLANDIDNLKIKQQQWQHNIELAVFNSQFMMNRIARINLPSGGL